MQIEFKKIGFEPKEFSLEKESLRFFGEFKKDRLSSNLIIIEGKIEGELPLSCDKCAIEFTKGLSEEIRLFASNGIYEKREEEDEIVVEFFNQKIDFDYIFDSEIASILSDYHVCVDCEKTK